MNKFLWKGDDTKQLVPFKYMWADEMYKRSISNNWTPEEIGMGNDLSDYRIELSDNERHVYDATFSNLSTLDIVVPSVIGAFLFKNINVPEISQYLARQIFEESIHNRTYVLMLENLGLDPNDVYQRFRNQKKMKPKFDFIESWASWFDGSLPNFIIGYFCMSQILEGTFFWNGFSPIFALGRRGKMRASTEQLQYIMRDEALHTKFGTKMVQTLISEGIARGMLPDKDINFIYNTCISSSRTAYNLEKQYVEYAIPEAYLGYSARDHLANTKYILNSRLTNCGMPIAFADAPIEDPLPWLNEMIFVKKETNFFERRVTEYQATQLTFDDTDNEFDVNLLVNQRS
jgi:ribonucleoside-diphosphate reductase beta chain